LSCLDRDGEKFAPVLNYLRGDRNTYIDPNEASFYCLPNASTSFHELVQKDILLCRTFLEKYQIDMLNELKERYFQKNSSIGSSTIQWALFKGMKWTSVCDGPKEKYKFINYEYEMLQLFKLRTSLFHIFLNEANLFWRPQGLLCNIIDNRDVCYISFTWNVTEGDQKSFQEALTEYSYGSNSMNKILRVKIV
jgi:hypothetical protein